MKASLDFTTCIICSGDGYITDTSDPGKTRREICPCQSSLYVESIMDHMVESGYAEKMDDASAKELGNQGCDSIKVDPLTWHRVKKEMRELIKLMPMALTSDNLWERLDSKTSAEVSARGGKIIGKVFREASSNGLIEEIGETHRSTRKEARGRKIPVWRAC